MGSIWLYGYAATTVLASWLEGFCGVNSVPVDEFWGALGAWTPCFTDVALLGFAHVLTIIVLINHLAASLRVSSLRLQLINGGSLWHWTSLGAVLILLTSLLLNLSAHLGATAAHAELPPAPFEYTEVCLACISWAMLGALLLVELKACCPGGGLVRCGRWKTRAMVLLSTSCELVKLRFLLARSPPADYFFFIYACYVAAQVFLSLVALAWYPGHHQLKYMEQQYQALPDGPVTVCAGVCPEAAAGVLSWLTFSWVSPLLALGYHTNLTRDDVWTLPQADRVATLETQFSKHWAKELASGSPSLGNACWLTTRGMYLRAAPWKAINDASQFVGPVFLNLLLKIVGDPNSPTWRGYLYAGIMFFGTLAGVLADSQHFQITMRAGFRLKALLCTHVHEQVLSLTPMARARFSSGRIFTLVSADADSLSSLCQSAFQLVSAPLRIIVAMYLLWSQLGSAALVAVAILMLIIPLNFFLTQASALLLKAALSHSDERTKLEGELMGGMEVVKCSGWADLLRKRIGQVRSEEISKLWGVSRIQALVTWVLYAVPAVVPVATFGAFLLLGSNLTAAEAFTALALLNILRFPLFMLPMLVQQLTTARVSLDRLSEFLTAPAVTDVAELPPAEPGQDAVEICGDFAWGQAEQAAPALIDVNLKIPSGTFVVVVGSTGSGKSSLLASMLSATQQVYGPPPIIRGRVAYVPQVPFILAGTVRENILLGAPYDAARYALVLQAACLETDLLQLPGGDHTELGDRGLNVSGGQKQRISVARALYASSPGSVVLLDDPLSALDAKVGKAVFELAIRGMLRESTVVLATNQLYVARHADLVLVLQNGRIAEQGTYSDLTKRSGSAFSQMMKETQVEADATEEADELEDKAEGDSIKSATPAASTALVDAQNIAAATKGKLTEAESSSKGGLSKHVVMSYINAMGGLLPALWLLITFLVCEAARVGTSVWLSVWTGDEAEVHGAGFYLTFYTAISGVLLVGQAVNTLEVARLSLRSARKLHDGLLDSLMAAPMMFYHTTPLGRIINRLTRDTSDVDRQVASSSAAAFRSFLQLGSTLVLVGWVAPFALPALTAIMVMLYLLYSYYQASMRQIKRLEAISRSPVLSAVAESVTGVATLRAFRAQKQAQSKLCDLVDNNNSISLASMSMNRWLSVRLETLGALATLAAAVVAVEQHGKNGPASMGLLLSFAMQVTALMSMTLRTLSQAELLSNSVERVVEYSSLDHEGHGPDEGGCTGTLAAPPSWPSEGVVQFREVTMRYRPGLPLVLRGVSFTANSKDKIGVVGRTGAGKSSMISCLFRLYEIESGSIEIDGLSTSRLALQRLRQGIILIPQVPVLFTGSIRMNLDPLGERSDAELWGALRRAHLATLIEGWPMGLSSALAEGGAPLSEGQKQLLALARAALHRGKILVLDEATANVDVETDALVQHTLRTVFADLTVIAIAHRLHTVIDYDKILVLDQGRVEEFGPPAELLEVPQGIFASLVADTGPATARFLASVAAGRENLDASYQEQALGALSRMVSGAKSIGLPVDVTSQSAPATPGLDMAALNCLSGRAACAMLAAQLQERAAAAARLAQEAVLNLAQAAEEEEAFVQALLLGGGDGLGNMAGMHGSVHVQLASARTALLQALHQLVAVEQGAAAASAAASRLSGPHIVAVAANRSGASGREVTTAMQVVVDEARLAAGDAGNQSPATPGVTPCTGPGMTERSTLLQSLSMRSAQCAGARCSIDRGDRPRGRGLQNEMGGGSIPPGQLARMLGRAAAANTHSPDA